MRLSHATQRIKELEAQVYLDREVEHELRTTQARQQEDIGHLQAEIDSLSRENRVMQKYADALQEIAKSKTKSGALARNVIKAG